MLGLSRPDLYLNSLKNTLKQYGDLHIRVGVGVLIPFPVVAEVFRVVEVPPMIPMHT